MINFCRRAALGGFEGETSKDRKLREGEAEALAEDKRLPDDKAPLALFYLMLTRIESVDNCSIRFTHSRVIRQRKMRYLCGTARHLPLILCLLTPLSIFLTYAIAVGNGHVSAFWPYISDTGTKPPESCIFGLLLSSVAFLLCAIVYVRYREVSEYAKLYPSVGITPFWNRVAASLGFFSALGLHMVANFQELHAFITHIVGALLCFFSATLYFFLQTVFTRKMQPEAKLKLWLRIVFTALNVLFIVGTFAPVGAAHKEFTGKDPLKWTMDHGGFAYHAISTFSEWLLVFSFCAYICTLFWDFRKIKIEPPRIQFIALEEGPREEASDVETTDDAGEGEAKGKSLWI